MARRYIIHTPPVAHMNGKLCRAADICHNQPDTSESPVTFYYGYRYKATDISRYALREMARNLSEHPYSDDELYDMQLFAQAVEQAKTLTRTRPAKVMAAFRASSYKRLYNYCIARLIQCNGQTPPEWL